MDRHAIRALTEALLFASGEPLDLAAAAEKLLVPLSDMRESAEEIRESCARENRGVELVRLGENRYQFVAKKAFEQQIRDVLAVAKTGPLSAAAFEVLAVIAYNQPVTKSFVEQVRGVDCSGVINTLLKRKLIEEAGRLDLPGRPLLYCTTDDFLRCFRISSVEELPEPPRHADAPDAQPDDETPGQLQFD